MPFAYPESRRTKLACSSPARPRRKTSCNRRLSMRRRASPLDAGTRKLDRAAVAIELHLANMVGDIF